MSHEIQKQDIIAVGGQAAKILFQIHPGLVLDNGHPILGPSAQFRVCENIPHSYQTVGCCRQQGRKP